MAKVENEAQPFNLFMAGNLAHEYKSLFENLTLQCGQKLELSLSQLLQTETIVESTFEIAQKKLDGNHCDTFYRSWIIFNNNYDSYASITIERKLSTSILDILCGGTGRHIEGQPIQEGPTSGERRSLLMLIKTLFNQMEEVYSAITPYKMMLTSKAQDAAAERSQLRKTEYIASATFNITANEGSGFVQINTPINLLAKTELGKRITNPEQQLAKLKTALEDVQLDITAIVGKQSASLRNILNLSPGDIIPLEQLMDADVYVGQKLFKRAKVKTDNGRLLLLIGENPNTLSNNLRTKAPEQAEETSKEPEEEPVRRRRTRSSRTSDNTETPTQTRSERREARQSNRKATRTRGA